MMKPLLLAAALGILAGSALAQNTKGTGAETRTTTTTNPEASVGLPTPSDAMRDFEITRGTSCLELTLIDYIRTSSLISGASSGRLT
jgi:hypothetical protein